MSTTALWLETFWLGMAMHLWQTTLVLAVLFVVAIGLRRAPARYGELLGWLALLKLVLPLALLGELLGPALAALLGPSPAGMPPGLTEYMRVVLRPGALAADPARSSASTALPYAALTVVWLLGMALLCRRWRNRAGQGPERGAPLNSAPAAVRSRIESAVRGTGIALHSVRLVSGSAVPAVRGLLQPRIELSRPLVESLPVDELRAVLLHEQTHRNRWDTLRATVLRAVLCVLFFYPPAWWVVRRLRASSELACDECVLAHGVSPAVYARALARALATNLGVLAAMPAAEVGLSRPSALPDRLDRIENAWRYRAMTTHRLLRGAAVLIVTASVVVPALLAGNLRPYPDAGMDSDRESSGPGDVSFAELERLALDPNPVILEFDDTALTTVLEALGKVSKVRFEFDGDLSRKVSVSYANLTPREVLVHLATAFHLRYEVVDPWTLRVRRDVVLAGVAGVTNPVLVPDSKVEPVYPEQAKADGLEGHVILQAMILRDGTVDDVEVLRASRPGVGFEESAVDAIRQWQYEPATKDGEPVDVYFAVFIDFKLR